MIIPFTTISDSCVEIAVHISMLLHLRQINILPLFFFPATIHYFIYIYVDIWGTKRVSTKQPTNAPSTLKRECFTPFTMVRPFLNKRVTHCLFSSPGGGVLPCPSITKSSCSICKGKHCRSEIHGAKRTSPKVALFICNNSKQPLYHSGWSRTDHVVS